VRIFFSQDGEPHLQSTIALSKLIGSLQAYA
jgi:hypothetical protein